MMTHARNVATSFQRLMVHTMAHKIARLRMR
jgi:hypothetical protein